MKITPVVRLDERLARQNAALKAVHPVNPAFTKLFAHLYGLEHAEEGDRVLEIGGSYSDNLSEQVLARGASYDNVALERTAPFTSTFPGAEVDGKKDEVPSTHIGDFMEYYPDQPYDLVVAVRVFEQGGIDNHLNTVMTDPVDVDRVANLQRLEVLNRLTAEGGYVVIGTDNVGCMFRDREITDAGFQIEHRANPFYGLSALAEGGYPANDLSELLVLRKPKT
tara:strand:+ start:619 stop:1287 length:669 start_codon:yes stop_codon:yes gene_type:complete